MRKLDCRHEELVQRTGEEIQGWEHYKVWRGGYCKEESLDELVWHVIYSWRSIVSGARDRYQRNPPFAKLANKSGPWLLSYLWCVRPRCHWIQTFQVCGIQSCFFSSRDVLLQLSQVLVILEEEKRAITTTKKTKVFPAQMKVIVRNTAGMI